MRIAEETIKEPSTSYCLITEGKVLPDIWRELKQGAWKNLVPEVFENNVKLGELNRSKALSVIPNILPIHWGMGWDDDKKCLIDPFFHPQLQTLGINDFLHAVERFFDKFKGKHIGVHLSGGLDSSIIIALLKHFNIPFSLVGMTSNRYEFRTEKYIQQLLATWGRKTVLIDYEDHLPLSHLDKVPPHQHPQILSMNYNTSKTMAIECQNMGIEVLFTGNGGDNVFADAVPVNPADCTWLPQGFKDTWLDDFAYASYGVEVVPFYADSGIMNTIYNLRKGQDEDNAKLWARQFLKDYLPKELVNYTYCADFWGLYTDGLQESIPTIRKLFGQAYELTENDYFSLQKTNELLNQDLLNANKTMYQAIESRISLAVWLNSLIEK